MAPLPRHTKAYYLGIMKLRQHILLPFELLMAICCYLDAGCLRAFALSSRMFADASLYYRFNSVTITSQLRAEQFFATQNFSTRIAPMVQHGRLSLEAFYPPRFTIRLQREEIQGRAQEFLIWIFQNVLNKFNNFSRVSFVKFYFNDTNSVSDTTTSKLQGFGSLPSPPKVRYVTLEDCNLSPTACNLLFAHFTQIQGLVIEDSNLLTRDPRPQILLPELTTFDMKWNRRKESLQSLESRRLDVSIDISKVKKLTINVSRFMGNLILSTSLLVGKKLREATSVEELEIDAYYMPQRDLKCTSNLNDHTL
ncbi:hypothetical protein C8Q75DRAFT_784543 [Abortiporus biennis]|nr:hypothetical protein C8Q75DRAFT_784543 [Abortiporus biennis]